VADQTPEEPWVWSVEQATNGNTVTGERWRTAINVRPYGSNFDVHWHYYKNNTWHRYWSTWVAGPENENWKNISCERHEQDIMHGGSVCIHYYWTCKVRRVDDKIEYYGQEQQEPPEGGDPHPNEKTKEPINTINGSMVYHEIDIMIPCPELNLEFRRTYNSGPTLSDGPLGAGWTHTYAWQVAETTLVFEVGSTHILSDYLVVRTGEGHEVWFHSADKRENHVWRFASLHDVDWTAEKLLNHEYQVILPGGITYRFDTNGILAAISTEWGNALELTYTNNYPSNLLVRVEHSNGLGLDLSYTNSCLRRIDTPSADLFVTYAYDALLLTNATRHASEVAYTTDYHYDHLGDHCLTQRIDCAGHVFSYGYEHAVNGEGETVSRCTNMVAGASAYKHSVAYHTNDNYSVVTYERDGSTLQVYTNYYDPDILRIEKIVGPCAANLVKSYSFDARRTMVTNETVRDHSLNEWTTLTMDYGEDMSHGVSRKGFGYCAEPTNWWSYTWEPDYGTLASTIDPEGHKTELEYELGSVSKVKRYYAATESYDTLYAHATNGLVSGVTNANGHSIHYAYDRYGRLNQVTPRRAPPLSIRTAYSASSSKCRFLEMREVALRVLMWMRWGECGKSPIRFLASRRVLHTIPSATSLITSMRRAGRRSTPTPPRAS